MYVILKQKAKERLLSVNGIRLRANRTIQAEGFFGCVKHDQGWDRLSRRFMENVELEAMLVCLGRNARRVMDTVALGLAWKPWTPAEGTVPQEPRKPSAKRLRWSMEAKRRKTMERYEKGDEEYRYYNPKEKKRKKR